MPIEVTVFQGPSGSVWHRDLPGPSPQPDEVLRLEHLLHPGSELVPPAIRAMVDADSRAESTGMACDSDGDGDRHGGHSESESLAVPDLSRCTVADLKQMCRERGVSGFSKLNKVRVPLAVTVCHGATVCQCVFELGLGG